MIYVYYNWKRSRRNRGIRIPLLAGRIEDSTNLGIVFSVPALILHRTRM